nr:hypothetical protein [Methylobacterium sp. L1A1]
MLDVEYLIAPRPLTGAMIYLYRTGVLRPRVKAALRDLAAAQGKELIVCADNADFRSALGGGSFFLDLGPHCCLWLDAEVDTAGRRAEDETMLAMFEDHARAPEEPRFILFVEEGGLLTTRAGWAAAEAAAFVLREPRITRETLGPALRGLQASTDLAARPNWLDQPGFAARFDEFWACRDPSLRALLHKFEDEVLIRVDPRTERFEPPEAVVTAPGRGRPASPVRCLRHLLAKPSGWALVDLIKVLDERQNVRVWSPSEVVIEVHRIAGEVLVPPGEPVRRAGEHARRGGRPGLADTSSAAILWAALVLAWDAHLVACARAGAIGDRRTPSLLIPTLDRLGRDFLMRSAMPPGEDQLGGHWGALGRVLTSRSGVTPGASLRVGGRGAPDGAAATDPLAARRDRTVRRLVECLDAATALRIGPWSTRLHRLTAATLTDAGAGDEACDDADAAWIPPPGEAR